MLKYQKSTPDAQNVLNHQNQPNGESHWLINWKCVVIVIIISVGNAL